MLLTVKMVLYIDALRYHCHYNTIHTMHPNNGNRMGDGGMQEAKRSIARITLS